MGGSEKHKKGKRKPQSKRPNSSRDNNTNNTPRTTASKPELVQTLSDESTKMVRARYYPAPSDWDPNPELRQAPYGGPGKNNDICNVKLNPYVGLDIDMKDWKFYTEEQLEELLLRKLEAIYNEAYVRLMSSGHPPDVVLKAILTNGHGFGNLDILTNIVQNSLGYIKTGFVIDNRPYRGQEVFGDMKMLVKNSLTVMIYLLLQVRPYLIKGDALWCLLMCNFHLGVASTIKLPFVTNEGESQGVENNRSLHAPSAVCQVQGDQLPGDDKAYDFSKNNPSEKVDVLMKRNPSIGKSYKLTPSLEAKLKMNVGNFAAGCRATVKMSPKQLQACKSSLPSKKYTESFEWEDSCMDNLVFWSSFGNLSLNEKSESEPLDPKVEIISRLVHNIKEIKQQVKERKEWAQKKVVQAAKKLSLDLSELKILRMEREGKQQLKNYELELEEETMMQVVQLEDDRRKTSCQADLADAAVKKLKLENAEIKAEVEAFKLSASESDKICVEVVRREKKCLKKILALEKQNNKYREEIEEEKKLSMHLHQQLVDLKKAQEEIEVMWRQKVKAKEFAIAQVQEELRLKEEVEANMKRKQHALHQKMDLDSQRCKDDIQRLEKEISLLELSLDSSNPHYQLDVFFTGELGLARPERDDALENMLPDLSELLDFSEEEVIHDRVCLICKENDASIVFLPCAHQVLCANCTENHCKNVQAKCPCCQDPIAHRIRVYGSSS